MDVWSYKNRHDKTWLYTRRNQYAVWAKDDRKPIKVVQTCTKKAPRKYTNEKSKLNDF